MNGGKKMEAQLKERQRRQLELIGHVDSQMACYLVAGGWAVDGTSGRITRYHENVDLMIYSDHVELAADVLGDYGMHLLGCGEKEFNPKTRPYFFRAEKGDLRADVIVMHPVRGGGLPPTESVRFITPYHGMMVQSNKALEGRGVELEGVQFWALKADALYTAKLVAARGATKEERERDEHDLRLLEPHISDELRRDMEGLKRHLNLLMCSGSGGKKGF